MASLLALLCVLTYGRCSPVSFRRMPTVTRGLLHGLEALQIGTVLPLLHRGRLPSLLTSAGSSRTLCTGM